MIKEKGSATAEPQFGPALDWQGRYSHYLQASIDYAQSLEAQERQGGLLPETISLLRRMQVCSDRVTRSQLNVGLSLHDTEPNRYITRSIGQRPPELAQPWTIVRGGIEVFRYLNNVRRNNVILGPAANEEWLEFARQHTIRSIVRLQLAQIMMSDNPEQMAEGFGQDLTIEFCRQPMPQLSREAVAAQYHEPTEPNNWLNHAVETYEATWPVYQGLSMDL